VPCQTALVLDEPLPRSPQKPSRPPRGILVLCQIVHIDPHPILPPKAHGSESEGSEDNDFIPSLTFSQLSFSVDMPDSQGLVTPEAEVTDWLSVQAADEHGRNIPSLASAKGGSLGPHWQRSQRVMSNSVYNLAFGLN